MSKEYDDTKVKKKPSDNNKKLFMMFLRLISIISLITGSALLIYWSQTHNVEHDEYKRSHATKEITNKSFTLLIISIPLIILSSIFIIVDAIVNKK